MAEMEQSVSESVMEQPTTTDNVEVNQHITATEDNPVEMISPAKSAQEETTPSTEETTPHPVDSPMSAPSSRSSSVSRSECGSSSTKSNEKKLPIRTGILWKVNAKVEAMDFLKKWYTAKIVEVDEEEQEVLIHFEGWNVRFDEWLEMTSDRLRPHTRHSDRKEGRRMRKLLQHKAGERVLAKWTDCRMYPAKVTSLLPSGAYEVVFYDGFKRIVQPINVKPLPEDLKAQHFDFAPSQTKPEDQVIPLKRKRSSDSRHEPGERRRSGESEEKPKKVPAEIKKVTSPTEVKKIASPMEVKKIASPTHVKKISSPTPVKKVTSPTHVKKITSSPAQPKKIMSPISPKTKRDERDDSPPRRKKPTKKVNLSKSPHSKKTDNAVLEFKRKRAAKDQKKKKQDAATAQFLRRKKKLLIGGVFQKKRNKMELANKIKEMSPKKKLLKSPSHHGRSASSHDAEIERDPPASTSKALVDVPPGLPDQEKAAVHQDDIALSKLIAPKEFKVEEDHNPYKCPFHNCDKGFRKESLLKYHMKYYHLEDGSPVPIPIGRKRKQTLSICSTDSDVSICSKSGGTSSHRPAMKKKRVISAPSVLENVPTEEGMVSDQGEETAEADMQSDSEQRSVSASLHDDLDDDSDHDDEVVNCMCGYNEENGLMIQCDVCLCWQHATCFDITVETLPSKYICYMCINPPGVRESARYIYDQDYFKYGQLARFSFLPGENDEKVCKSMVSSHHLMADIININQVLGGLRRKTYMLQNSDEDEFRIWHTNWDTYCPEDIGESSCDHSANLSNLTNEDNESALCVEEKSTALENNHCGTDIDHQMARQDSVEHIDVCGEHEVEKPLTNHQPIVNNTGTETCNGDIKEDSEIGDENKPESNSIRPTSFGVSFSSLPVGNNDAIYKLSPVPTHVKVTGSSLWTPVARNLSQPDLIDEYVNDDINNNLELAEQNLTEHIRRLQDEVESRMDLIEQQVTELENQYAKPIGKDTLSDLPVIKKSLRTFISDLGKVRRMAAFHC